MFQKISHRQLMTNLAAEDYGCKCTTLIWTGCTVETEMSVQNFDVEIILARIDFGEWEFTHCAPPID